MIVFHKLCKIAAFKSAQTEWVSAMCHSRPAAVSSTGWDLKQRNVFVHILSFWSEILRGSMRCWAEMTLTDALKSPVHISLS